MSGFFGSPPGRAGKVGLTVYGRAGKVGLTVYVDPAVRLQLKVLAAEEHTSVQSLVFEGLNMLFASRHRPEIAR